MRVNIRKWEEIYKWNKENENYMVYPDEEVVRIVKKSFLPNGVQNVLDVGCGSGRHSLCMLRESLAVYAIDTSATALSIAQRLANEAGYRLHTQLAYATSMPFCDRSFDAVLCWGLIHYLAPSEASACVREIYRVLKPGGLFALTLRSRADSEALNPKNDQGMSISNADESKGILFRYYGEDEIGSTLYLFEDIQYGHKTYTFLGNTQRVIAHWFILARKGGQRREDP